MSDELLGVLSRIANSIEGIEQKMERFVVAIEATKKSNDEWLDGRVTIDVHTHTALLSAVTKLSEHFDQWFETQGKAAPPATPAQQALREISDALTASVDVQDARVMGEELQALFRDAASRPNAYLDGLLPDMLRILKKHGYAP